MRYFKVAFSCLLGLGLLGCAGSVRHEGKAPPDWVNGESARYSASQYLLGRGADAQLDNAKDRARADLAKTFEVAVSEESRDVQSVKQQSGKEGMQQSGELDVSRAIKTRTDAIVRGMEIADVWRDPVSRQYYALAVLPRAQAARGLRQDIQDLDEATGGYIAQARGEGEGLSKIAAAMKAVTAQHERSGLQRMLRVLDVSGQGMSPKWNERELQADLDTLLARVSIAPRAAGHDSAALDTALRGALADAGLRTSEGEADYVIEASLDLDDLGLREGWYWYVGRLELVLRDHSGEIRGSRRWPIKESSTVNSVARQRALDKAAEILKRALRTTLLDFVGG